MTADKEFERVLGNPENVIISKSLEGVLSSLDEHSSADISEDKPSEENHLTISGKSYIFSLKKIEIEDKVFSFTLEVPSLSTRDLLRSDSVEAEIEGEHFIQIPNEIVSWENNLLTIKTRRIFNETV